MKEFPAVSEMRGMLFVVLTVGVIFRVIFPMTPVLEVVFFLGFISFLDMVRGSFEPTTSEAVLFSEAHQEYGASGILRGETLELRPSWHGGRSCVSWSLILWRMV